MARHRGMLACRCTFPAHDPEYVLWGKTSMQTLDFLRGRSQCWARQITMDFLEEADSHAGFLEVGVIDWRLVKCCWASLVWVGP